MAVEPVDERLDRWLVKVSQVGCGLACFLSEDVGLRVDEAEGVDDDLALDGLDGVNDDGDGAGGQLLEGLLSVDIDAREPATKAGVRVVPSDDGFRPVLELESCVYLGPTGAGGNYRPVCFNMSIIFVWNTGSTASTDTPVPLWGIANTYPRYCQLHSPNIDHG